MMHTVHLSSVIKRIGGWLKEPLRMIVFLIVIIALVTAGYFTWRHFLPAQNPSANISSWTPTQDEKVDAQFVNDKLASKDYESYQASQRSLAVKYLAASQPVDALRIMSETINKVPADKVDAATYLEMVETQKAANNSAEQKKYLTLYIEKSKVEEGSNPNAAALIDSAQKELNSLQ